MDKIRLYILTKNGVLLPTEITELLVKSAKKYGEIEDFGCGSAYNIPVYLLGEIEKHIEKTFVVAWDMDGDMPHPRAIIGEEVLLLIKALQDDIEGDSWEIAVEVNKKIRGIK